MITLHHVPASRSFRVMWLLEELGLEYDVRMYDIADGSLRDPDFLKLSPVGRVPALEYDGTVLFESGAIVQWLCEQYPQSGLMPQPNHPDRAVFLEMLGFAETMASLIENLNMSHVFLRDPSKASPVTIKLITARLAATLKAVEEHLGSRDTLLPSGFSAADVMMGPNLYLSDHFVKLEAFPALCAYRASFEGREAYRRARKRDGKQNIYSKDFYPVPEAT